MSIWIDQPENSNVSTEFFFLIDDTYLFLIDDTYKLIIDDGISPIVWTDQGEN